MPTLPPLKYLIKDVLELPRYRQQSKVASRRWRDRAEVIEYAPPYRGTWGQMRRRRLLKIEPEGGLEKVKGWFFYLHGGGWTFGKPDDFLSVADCVVAEGYGLIMPTYRRLPRYHCDQMLSDFRLSLVECNRRGWNLSTQAKPIMAGMSSGGHLAALIGLDSQLWTDANWSPPEHVLCCGAPLDLDAMPYYPGMSLLEGGNREISPVKVLENANEVPNFLLIHPTHDGMAPLPQALSFYEVLKNKTATGKLHRVKDKGHLGAGRWMFDDNETKRLIIQMLNDNAS
ncbi:MAG: alpha/beta hydrolase [Bacteroidota bacterium]